MRSRAIDLAIASLVVVAALSPHRAGAVDTGTTITAEEVDRAAERLLPGTVQAVRRGMRIEVVEPRPVRWRKAFLAATEQHAGQVRLGDDGELEHYVAGLPFPNVDPHEVQAGTTIMWNHAVGPWVGDDSEAWSVEWQIGKVAAGRPMEVVAQERSDAVQSKWIKLIGRTEVPPVPALPDNPDQVRIMEIYGPTLPVFQALERSGPMLTYRYWERGRTTCGTTARRTARCAVSRRASATTRPVGW